MADEIAVPYVFPRTTLSSCCRDDVWKITSSFTLTLISGLHQINPLVQQDIGFALRGLLRIDNVLPVVAVRTVPQAMIGTPYITYYVEAVYPFYVQGRRVLADGTICSDADVVPVGIPQVRAQGDSLIQKANACLVTTPSPTPVTAAEWRTVLATAANEDLGYDEVVSFTFTTFRIMETASPCLPLKRPSRK